MDETPEKKEGKQASPVKVKLAESSNNVDCDSQKIAAEDVKTIEKKTSEGLEQNCEKETFVNPVETSSKSPIQAPDKIQNIDKEISKSFLQEDFKNCAESNDLLTILKEDDKVNPAVEKYNESVELVLPKPNFSPTDQCNSVGTAVKLAKDNPTEIVNVPSVTTAEITKDSSPTVIKDNKDNLSMTSQEINMDKTSETSIEDATTEITPMLSPGDKVEANDIPLKIIDFKKSPIVESQKISSQVTSKIPIDGVKNATSDLTKVLLDETTKDNFLTNDDVQEIDIEEKGETLMKEVKNTTADITKVLSDLTSDDTIDSQKIGLKKIETPMEELENATADITKKLPDLISDNKSEPNDTFDSREIGEKEIGETPMEEVEDTTIGVTNILPDLTPRDKNINDTPDIQEVDMGEIRKTPIKEVEDTISEITKVLPNPTPGDKILTNNTPDCQEIDVEEINDTPMEEVEDATSKITKVFPDITPGDKKNISNDSPVEVLDHINSSVICQEIGSSKVTTSETRSDVVENASLEVTKETSNLPVACKITSDDTIIEIIDDKKSTSDSKENENKQPTISAATIEVVEDGTSDITPVSPGVTAEGKINEMKDGKQLSSSVENESKKVKKCLNVECKSHLNLVKANSSVFAYYAAKKTKKTDMVCVSCEEVVSKHFEELMDAFQKGENLLKVGFPERKEIVCIDSDEEIEISSDSEDSEGAPFDAEAMELINSQINEMLESKIPLDNVEKQAEQWKDDLTKSVEDLASQTRELKVLLCGNQRQLDKINQEFYKPFRRPIEALDPIDITSDEETNTVPPLVPISNTPGASVGRVQEEFSQQHSESLLQRHLLGKDTTITPAALTASPATRTIADDMIVEERRTNTTRPLNLPRLAPAGVSVQKPPVIKDSVLWCMRKSDDQAWGKCIVEEVINVFDETQKHTKRYKVKWIPEKKSTTIAGNVMAFTEPNEYLYRVGMRIIALFSSNSYYAGTVAEIPKETNRWRYLIFFDDGYTSYVYHEHILMICEPSEKTQDDVPPLLRDFIREYLHKYPERPLVKMNPGDKIITLYRRKWVSAKILEVDCSLARLHFGTGNECDWIYRGSDRLRPLYENKVNAARRLNIRRGRNTFTNETGDPAQYMVPLTRPKVQTARKSLAGRSSQPSQVYYETGADKKITWTPVKVPGQIIYKSIEGVDILPSKKFIPHTCNRNCVSWLRWNYNDLVKKVNFLAIPLYTGFRRLVQTFQNTKKCIMYKAPCGRTLRSSEQLVLYLFNTRSKWTIDMFEFDHFVDCLREFTIENANITIKDMSNGRENVPISCVNYIDTDVPKTVDYMTERKPKEGVVINTNSEFLVCCDCTDDCRNKEECACWQLTINEARRLSSNIEPKLSTEYVGYQNRRLPEKLTSGIFECNERCKCKYTCHNRVVQFPMVQKLQLFKTEMKGWGLRCLHDIPAGTFICIYVGHLLTDNDADEEGTNYGDEYLADLDFIETAERYKESYESDVPEEDLMEDDASDNEVITNDDNGNDKDLDAILNSDDDSNTGDDEIRSRLRKRKVTQQTKRDGKRKPSSLMMTLKTVQKKAKPKKSLREYFGDDESVYIMDARTSGNIGRYLNHSCSPNVYVQNVFVDTHDPRFPWISFFASRYIKSGDELTWDYSYDIGSVHDKVKYCYCGSAECRERLL